MKDILRALAYILRYKRLALLALVSIVLATLFALIVPRILKAVIDQGLPQSVWRGLFTPRFLAEGLTIQQARSDLIIGSAVLLLGLSVLRAAVAFGQRFFGERLSQRVAYDIRNDFYDKVQHLPFTYHDQSQMGQIISRAITDIDSVRQFVAQGLTEAVSVTLIFAGVIGAMISLNAPLTFIAMIPMIPIATLAIRLGLKQIAGWYLIMEKMGGLSNLLEETVVGVQVVRAFNRQRAEAQRWAATNYELYLAQIAFTKRWSTYFPAMAFFVALSTALVLWFGGPAVMSHTVSIGTIVALNGYILLLALPVQRMGFVVQQFSGAVASAHRVFDILDTPLVLTDKADALPLPPIQGHVKFENVTLKYRPDGPMALKDVCFETKPDQVIGIVGPTGAGKSSIINLITRFYDVTEGRVTVDGHDVRDVKLHSLRSQIGIVQQETLLFTATIRANIAYGRPDASEEEVIAAAKAADAHKFIMEMPQGYNTKIGERGATLSGGQRQRVAIARALLIQPRILILDDATSSVDTRTENAIQQALAGLMKDRVTFIVAQRLSAIRSADLILVVDHGEIVERGTHDSLIAQGGLYGRIYEEQMQDQERVRLQGRVD